jgi:hypothetical protein
MRELRINSPGVLQVRKEEIEVEDLVGRTRKEIGRGVEKKKAALTSGTTVSTTRRETGGSAHANWAISWARPKAGKREKRKTGHVRGRQAGHRRGLGCRLSWAENREEKIIPFSFFFSNISKLFQIILNPLLNLNQTTQYKISKCNSMSAQTCSYPYI